SAPREHGQVQVAGDVVPGGAVAGPATEIRTGAVQQVGGEKDDGSGGTDQVHGLIFLHLRPRAVSVDSGPGFMLHQVATPVASRNHLEAAILNAGLFQVDGAAHDPIRVGPEVVVILMPARGSGAADQHRIEFGPKDVDIGAD